MSEEIHEEKKVKAKIMIEFVEGEPVPKISIEGVQAEALPLLFKKLAKALEDDYLK